MNEMTDKALAVFENYKIRRHYDEVNEAKSIFKFQFQYRPFQPDE